MIYIDDKGREFEVEYEVYGRYYPQTMYSPEEWPELEITKITYKGKNFFDMLNRTSAEYRRSFLEDVQEKAEDHADQERRESEVEYLLNQMDER